MIWACIQEIVHADCAFLNRKYQFMEANTQRRDQGLKEKIPDIQKTLDTVKFLRTRKVSILHGSICRQSA